MTCERHQRWRLFDIFLKLAAMNLRATVLGSFQLIWINLIAFCFGRQMILCLGNLMAGLIGEVSR
jgi:hypothetical protein